MSRRCISLFTVLVLIIATGAYKFIIEGSVKPASDGRLAIVLTEGERDLVLGEMRAFLSSIQQINKGIAEDNMELVAAAARMVGKAAAAEVPTSLMGKLPIAFKKLGRDTHIRFDQMALDAESFADGKQALMQLATLMENCVACHAAHRFEVELKQ